MDDDDNGDTGESHEENGGGERRTLNRADVRQKRIINRLLEAHLIIEDVVPPGARVPKGKYEEGWDDDRIAKEADSSKASVVYLRNSAFCTLTTGRKPFDREGFAGALGDVEDRLKEFVKAEIEAVLELIKPGPGQGGVTAEQFQALVDRFNNINGRLEHIEQQQSQTKATMAEVLKRVPR
jgi:hypothetical protein